MNETSVGLSVDVVNEQFFPMRIPCRKCGETHGSIKHRNGQDCVFCCSCDVWCYNAPRVETGKAKRTVTTIHNGIKPKQRARILMRDNRACVICHATDKPLHVGHLLSVDAGESVGLTEVELNDDSNLATMCDECNLGIGKEPLPLRIMAAILKLTLKGVARQ